MTDPIPPASPAPAGSLPPPPPAPSAPPGETSAQPAGESRPVTVNLGRPPRVGDVTLAWRIVIALTWVGVVIALAAVWNASVQLGLSTWWLGPRGQPRPLAIKLSPFVPPVLMLLGTINLARWLGWSGLVAAALVVAVGVGDLGRVDSIATVEILIGVAAAAVSLASLTGTYRRAADDNGVVGAHAD